jgi:hypothetical protein
MRLGRKLTEGFAVDTEAVPVPVPHENGPRAEREQGVQAAASDIEEVTVRLERPVRI